MSTTATLGPAVLESAEIHWHPPPTAAGNGVTHIPVHRLSGEARDWADRLLGVFSGAPADGLEWSMKFSAAGLVGNRFLVGLNREHWSRLDGVDLRRALAIPADVWPRIREDMRQARAAYFSYEPDDGAGIYRVYLELLPTPQALRAAGSLTLGRGYKWDPVRGRTAAVTDYRMHDLPSPAAFDQYLQPYYERLSAPLMREVAQRVVGAARRQADPCGFMFLEATESDSRRDSFSVTFRGTRLPLIDFVPDLLRLAGGLALPAQQVLDCLVPDEPRSLYSLAAGVTRDGQDFLTVYYD